MIKKTISTKITTVIKGTLVGVDDSGLHVRDAKSNQVNTVAYDLFQEYDGEEITISVGRTEKTEEIIGGDVAAETVDESCCDCNCDKNSCNCDDDCVCVTCADSNPF